MPHLILYDGVCGLCDRIVRFVLPRDRQKRFRFAAIQGDHAGTALVRHGRSAAALDTFYVLVDEGAATERLLDRSTAMFFVMRELGGVWAALAWLRVLPRALTDWGYDLVARVRYRVFGKFDTCVMPRPEWRDRFIA